MLRAQTEVEWLSEVGCSNNRTLPDTGQQVRGGEAHTAITVIVRQTQRRYTVPLFAGQQQDSASTTTTDSRTF